MPTMQGEEITYTLTVSNNGPDTALSAVLCDARVLCDLLGVQYSQDGGVTFLPFPGTLLLGDLPLGFTGTVLLRGRIRGDAGMMINTATISSQTIDPNPNNNTASAAVCIFQRQAPAPCCCRSGCSCPRCCR